jgi:hypothetical protein
MFIPPHLPNMHAIISAAAPISSPDTKSPSENNKDYRNLDGGREIIKDAVNTGEANKSLE